MAGYVTAAPAIVRTELCAREASSFCDFWKNDLLRFHVILLFFWLKQTFSFWDVIGKEYYNKSVPNFD